MQNAANKYFRMEVTMINKPLPASLQRYIAVDESVAFDVFADAEPVDVYSDESILLFVQETPDVTIRVSAGETLSLKGWREDAKLHRDVKFEDEQPVVLSELPGKRQAVSYTRLGAEGFYAGDDGKLDVFGSETVRLWDVCQEVRFGEKNVLQNWIVHESKREEYLQLESQFFNSLRLV